jgi:predicted CoA-binding protein
VASYLISCGYIIFGVRPDGDEVLGRPCYPRLADVPEAIDLVDVFRHPRHLPEHTDEAIAVGVQALWFQLGVVDEASALRAQDAGITVVMNRCLMVEHGRLMGS